MADWPYIVEIYRDFAATLHIGRFDVSSLSIHIVARNTNQFSNNNFLINVQSEEIKEYAESALKQMNHAAFYPLDCGPPTGQREPHTTLEAMRQY